MYIIELKVKEKDLHFYNDNEMVLSIRKLKSNEKQISLLNEIISILVSNTNVTYSQFNSGVRGVLEVSESRHMARYFIRKYTTLSLRRIGEHTGLKTHASVVNSLKVVNNLIDPVFGDKYFLKKFKKIENILIEKYGY